MTGLLAGRYALVLTIATVADAPWFPPVRGGSTSWVRVDVTDDEVGLVQTGKVCGVEIDGAAVARVEVPAAFLRAIPESVTRPVIVGERYRVELAEEIVGFVGGPGAALPTDLSGTTDWDSDGRPAATIELHIPAVGRAELYVVQAARLVLVGTLRDGEVAGTVTIARFEQATLGARPRWLAGRTTITPDASRSRFHLVPVAPDADCDEVLAVPRP